MKDSLQEMARQRRQNPIDILISNFEQMTREDALLRHKIKRTEQRLLQGQTGVEKRRPKPSAPVPIHGHTAESGR